MEMMNPLMLQWGPALLLLLGIVLGTIYNNRSIAHLDPRITDSIRSSDARHADLKDFIRSEISRLESRIDRLEHPVIRS